MNSVTLSRISLALLGVTAMTGAIAAPASASVDEESNGEILEVSYPDGPLSFTGLMPGGGAEGHAVVTNTSDIDVEVLVTTEWSETEAAESGVVLAGVICEDPAQRGECVGEPIEFALEEEACTIGVIPAQQGWDIRLAATLPLGAGNEAQNVSSPFAVNFAVASEVYDGITEGGPVESVATNCPSPDGDLIPDPDPQDEPADDPAGTEAPSPTDEAAEAPTQQATDTSAQQVTDAPEDGPAESAEGTDEGLAATGANIWTAVLLGLAMVLIGSVLVRNYRCNQRGAA